MLGTIVDNTLISQQKLLNQTHALPDFYLISTEDNDDEDTEGSENNGHDGRPVRYSVYTDDQGGFSQDLKQREKLYNLTYQMCYVSTSVTAAVCIYIYIYREREMSYHQYPSMWDY